MASVLLSSDSLVDDFLAPGQACVNPLYSEPPKPAAVPRRRARVTLQMEDDAPGGSDLEATAGAEAMRAASHRPMVGWDILQWVEQVEQ